MPQPGSLCGVWDVIVSLVGSRVPWTVLADLMVCPPLRRRATARM